MKFNLEQNFIRKSFFWTVLAALSLFNFGCVPPQTTTTDVNANVVPVNTNTNINTAPSPVAAVENKELEMKMPVTLPVLDAMFADADFAKDLKSNIQLTDEEIDKIKKAAHDAIVNLRDDEPEDSGSTRAAMKRADTQIRQIIGDEKTEKLFDAVRQHWSNAGDAAGNSGSQPSSEINNIPSDTRIVVNAPAYRMDLFQEGKLVKTYKIGIGYPEFPLPSGMRQAKTIIFNPTWTPPDEAWVKGKIQAGKTIEAGSKDNPLGPIKIPIGSPSLIHGGKSAAKLGGFASHGCVGLTNSQVQDFTLNLAKLSGIDLTQQQILDYAKQKTETKNVKLDQPIPVELRYETIVVENGKLNIFRDVYERGTNTEENLRRVLDNYGVSFDNLSQPERDKILKGLEQMAYNAKGDAKAENSDNSNAANANANSKADDKKSSNKNSNTENVVITRNIKGKKQFSFDLADLKGKGYPAPVDLSQQ